METRLTKGNQNNELKDTKAATTAKSGDILIHLSSFFFLIFYTVIVNLRRISETGH